VNPYSDLPEWMWSAPLDGHPRLYLSADVPDFHRDLTLWRWTMFLAVESSMFAAVRGVA
jgi:hypothetical protein